MLALARAHAEEVIAASFESAKKRWDESHVPPKVFIGDEVLISTLHFGKLGPAKLSQPWIGPFTVTDLVGPNAVRVHLTAPWEKRHPVFPISLIKVYKSSPKEVFGPREQPPPPSPEINQETGEEEWEVAEIVKERQRKVGRGQKVTEYLVRWVGFTLDQATWEPEQGLRGAPDVLHRWKTSQRKHHGSGK